MTDGSDIKADGPPVVDDATNVEFPPDEADAAQDVEFAEVPQEPGPVRVLWGMAICAAANVLTLVGFAVGLAVWGARHPDEIDDIERVIERVIREPDWLPIGLVVLLVAPRIVEGVLLVFLARAARKIRSDVVVWGSAADVLVKLLGLAAIMLTPVFFLLGILGLLLWALAAVGLMQGTSWLCVVVSRRNACIESHAARVVRAMWSYMGLWLFAQLVWWIALAAIGPLGSMGTAAGAAQIFCVAMGVLWLVIMVAYAILPARTARLVA